MTQGNVTSDRAFAHDVAVIGLGRIGLPLALAFADRSLRVVGVDRDSGMLDRVRDGVMPFQETGTQELLERTLTADRLTLSEQIEDSAAAESIVLTLGTPSLQHVEIDISQIRSVLDALLPVLRPGHSIVLRSTIAPGTTEFVAGYIEKHRGLRVDEEILVAHVPERVAVNHFLEELQTLPQIVGGVGERSTRKAAELFSVFGAPILETAPVQAELAKIWTNIYRYASFALPNLLMMDCEQYDANVFEVVDLINRDYPRGGIARPGLTAGSCLRKDFNFSEERSRAPGMLLAVSRVNESVPHFLVEGVKRRVGSLRERKVAVLGLTFKAESDDLRDSLSPKLIRFLERELADVTCHDAVAPTPDSEPLETALHAADIVVCATDHSLYRQSSTLEMIRERSAPGCLLVDPWNAFGLSQVFAHVDEAPPSRGPMTGEARSRTA